MPLFSLEGTTALERAPEAEPGNAGYLDSLGWACSRRGKSDESPALLRRALEKRAGESLILEHIGEVCRSLGDLERAHNCPQ